MASSPDSAPVVPFRDIGIQVRSLEQLLEGNSAVVGSIFDDFKKRGFSFVELPLSFQQHSFTIVPLMQRLFRLTPEAALNDLCIDETLGYTKSTGKQGFRILSGTHLSGLEDLLSTKDIPEMRGNFTPFFDFARSFDKTFIQMLSVISTKFFSCNPETLGENYSLPLLLSEKEDVAKFGMIDLALYSNREGQYNCSSHIDPGLISLSLFSTSEGLQLFDRETNQWVESPISQNYDVGILWCGEAATKANGNIKSCVHRVKEVNSSRMTLWYELCTSNQSFSSFLNKKEFKFTSLRSKEDYGVVRLFAKTLTGKVIDLGVFDTSETMYRIKERIEEKEGIPPAKMRIVWAGRGLADERSISDYGMKSGDTIHLVLAL